MTVQLYGQCYKTEALGSVIAKANMFIVQATGINGVNAIKIFGYVIYKFSH